MYYLRMLLINLMMNPPEHINQKPAPMRYLLLILAWIIGISNIESAVAEPNDRFTCGATSVQVFNTGRADNPYFSLRLVREQRHRDMDFSTELEHFSVRCEPGGKGKQYLLVNQACTASGCSASNWGIIDPRLLKLVLEANQPYLGNEVAATELIGHSPQPFNCSSRSPNSVGAQGKGEYCYISPLR